MLNIKKDQVICQKIETKPWGWLLCSREESQGKLELFSKLWKTVMGRKFRVFGAIPNGRTVMGGHYTEVDLAWCERELR